MVFNETIIYLQQLVFQFLGREDIDFSSEELWLFTEFKNPSSLPHPCCGSRLGSTKCQFQPMAGLGLYPLCRGGEFTFSPIRPLAGQIPQILPRLTFCWKCNLLSLFPSVASEKLHNIGEGGSEKKAAVQGLLMETGKQGWSSPLLPSLPNCKTIQESGASWFLRYFI